MRLNKNIAAGQVSWSQHWQGSCLGFFSEKCTKKDLDSTAANGARNTKKGIFEGHISAQRPSPAILFCRGKSPLHAYFFSSFGHLMKEEALLPGGKTGIKGRRDQTARHLPLGQGEPKAGRHTQG